MKHTDNVIGLRMGHIHVNLECFSFQMKIVSKIASNGRQAKPREITTKTSQLRIVRMRAEQNY